MIAATLALFGPLLAKLAAFAALALAGFAAWKTHGAIKLRQGAELQRQNDRIADARTAAAITAARADVAAAGDADLDRLLDANAATARRLVVQGNARDRARRG